MKAMSGKLAVATILFLVVTLPAIGKEVFLSDLKPISFKVLAGIFGEVGPLKDIGREKKPLILNGVEYKKGIMMHVAGDGVGEAIYDVAGFRTFRADIGIDENNGAVPPRGSVVFFIFVGDGKKWEEKFQSDVIRGDTPLIPKIEIDLSGAPQLRLFVTDAGDGIDADHATWGNARIDTKPLPVKPLGKLSTTWGSIKAAY